MDFYALIQCEQASGPFSPFDYGHTMLVQLFLKSHLGKLPGIIDAIKVKMSHRFFTLIVAFKHERGACHILPVDPERSRKRSSQYCLASAQRTRQGYDKRIVAILRERLKEAASEQYADTLSRLRTSAQERYLYARFVIHGWLLIVAGTQYLYIAFLSSRLFAASWFQACTALDTLLHCHIIA
jgi:hypothetical protein